jgi:hypothetical protein
MHSMAKPYLWQYIGGEFKIHIVHFGRKWSRDYPAANHLIHEVDPAEITPKKLKTIERNNEKKKKKLETI